jgi:hypothetical protein
MHGGLSTGPRTAEGLVRLRAARTRHGGYSAENVEALRRANAFIAETRALLALHRAGAHPVEVIAPGRRRLVDLGVAGSQARVGGKTHAEPATGRLSRW